MCRYLVQIHGHSSLVTARFPGGAFRKAVRDLIRRSKLKRQPRTDSDGGWENTLIALIPA